MSEELTAQPASGLMEAIAHIQKTAIKATATKIPISNTAKTIVVTAAGEIREIVEPARRQNILNTVADVGRFHDYFCVLCEQDPDSCEGNDGQPSVWIDDQGVTIIENDSSVHSAKQNRATLLFKNTIEFLKIQALDAIDPRTGKQVVISQQHLLKLTRTAFYDAFVTPQARNVLQGLLKSMSSNTELGKGALALTTTSRDGEFPDYFTLHTRVFDDPVLRDLPRREIRIHIEILPQGQGFELTPNSQDMDQAVYAEVSDLRNILQGELSETALLFSGSPEERNHVPE